MSDVPLEAYQDFVRLHPFDFNTFMAQWRLDHPSVVEPIIAPIENVCTMPEVIIEPAEPEAEAVKPRRKRNQNV
jgi:hypothetical protein